MSQEKLKQKFAQKMLDEKLDFLPLEESLQLLECDINLDTRFSWVCRTEELEDNGEYMTTKQLLASLEDIYGEPQDYHLTIGKKYDEYDEFTLDLAPAPTYIDLIK
jgi:hypothetical protein